jgi:hypothetical protein
LLDKNIYRKITKIAYSENKSIERVVNDILREYIDVFFPLRKIGLVHVTTDTIKMIFQDISDKLIIDHAKNLSKRLEQKLSGFLEALRKCKWISNGSEHESIRKKKIFSVCTMAIVVGGDGTFGYYGKKLCSL